MQAEIYRSTKIALLKRKKGQYRRDSPKKLKKHLLKYRLQKINFLLSSSFTIFRSAPKISDLNDAPEGCRAKFGSEARILIFKMRVYNRAS